MDQIQVQESLVWVLAPEITEPKWVVPPEIATPKRRARRKSTPKIQRQSERLLSIAGKMGWEDVKVIGRGLVTKPTRLNGWLVVPIEQFKESIPQEVHNRMKILALMGEKVTYLIADDLRKIEELERKEAERVARAESLNKAVKTAGKVVAYTVLGAAAVALLPIVAVGAALVYDPLLIAVTEDGEWVSLYTWYD